MKRRGSAIKVGGFIFRMADILSGSGDIPVLSITWPRKVIFSSVKGQSYSQNFVQYVNYPRIMLFFSTDKHLELYAIHCLLPHSTTRPGLSSTSAMPSPLRTSAPTASAALPAVKKYYYPPRRPHPQATLSPVELLQTHYTSSAIFLSSAF